MRTARQEYEDSEEILRQRGFRGMSTSLAAIILTPLCLMAYVADIALHMMFLSWRVFWHWNENKWQRVEFVFVIMFILDYIMLVVQWAVGRRLLQVFRCLRAAIILVKVKNVQHVYEVVMSIVVKLGKVFLVITVFILMFSAIGVNLFKDFYHCIGQNTALSNCTTETPNLIYTGSFDNVAITFLRLFVLLSTENYPELMIPAYSQNKTTFIYFGIFLFVGVFFLTAILLAIVVDSYWEFSKKYVKEERARERAELAKAWNLLDPLGKGSLPITDERFLKLFKILKPSNTEEMNSQLISYIDSNNDGEIDSLEWTLRLNETLSFEFEVENFCTDRCGPLWMREAGGVAQRIVRSDTFARIILMLIILHCALFCLTWYNMPEYLSTVIQTIKTVIMMIFMAEIFLSISGECLNLFHVIEVLDISLSLVAIGANLAWYFSAPEVRGVCNVIGGLAVAFRVGFNSLQTKRILIMFFSKIFPVMSDLLILILIIGYFYAVVGWESFSHVTPNLSIEAGHYSYGCGVGFETFWCSLLIVFQIVTTSNWHEIMNSAMLSSSTWSCLYFITCFGVINMVVMNLFVAIAIEAFNKLGKERDLETEGALTGTEEPDEETTIADSAKTFINNLLESSKTEHTKDREQMRSAATPRIRRRSMVNVTSSNVSLPGIDFGNHLTAASRPPARRKEEEEGQAENSRVDEDSSDEDLSHLTPEQRKKKMMKKRLERKRRKKRALQTIVVTTAFRPSKDQEIPLNVGDKVEVLRKQDDWWEGKVDGQQGWFPASHVKEFKAKTQPIKTRHMSLDNSSTSRERKLHTRSFSDSAAPGRSRSVVHPPTFEKESSGTDTLNVSLGSTGGGGGSRHAKPKLKLRSSGNWRKEILGDITVINPQELRELNKILKAQHSISSTSKLNSTGPMRRVSSMSESIEEEEEPDIVIPVPTKTKSPPRPVMQAPQISLDRAPTLPLLTEEDEDEAVESKRPPPDGGGDEDRQDTLTVEQPPLPPELKKKRNKEQSRGGEMPSWMAKFVESNNLNITTDVKFEEENKGKVEEPGDGATDSTVPTPANYTIPGIVIEEDTSV